MNWRNLTAGYSTNKGFGENLMSVISGMAIYFIIWWTSLFAMLPFGLRTQAEEQHVVPGTVPSAPARPHMWLAFLRTTILATIIFGLFWLITVKLDFGLDDIPHFFPDLD
jgi:predicted secreted protein